MHPIEVRDRLLQHLPEFGLALNLLAVGSLLLLTKAVNAGDLEVIETARFVYRIFGTLGALTAGANVPLLIFAHTFKFLPAPEAANIWRPERVGNFILTFFNITASSRMSL